MIAGNQVVEYHSSSPLLQLLTHLECVCTVDQAPFLLVAIYKNVYVCTCLYRSLGKICGWKFSSWLATHHYKLLYVFMVRKFRVFDFCRTQLQTKNFSCQIFPNMYMCVLQ